MLSQNARRMGVINKNRSVLWQGAEQKLQWCNRAVLRKHSVGQKDRIHGGPDFPQELAYVSGISVPKLKDWAIEEPGGVLKAGTSGIRNSAASIGKWSALSPSR